MAEPSCWGFCIGLSRELLGIRLPADDEGSSKDVGLLGTSGRLGFFDSCGAGKLRDNELFMVAVICVGSCNCKV